MKRLVSILSMFVLLAACSGKGSKVVDPPTSDLKQTQKADTATKKDRANEREDRAELSEFDQICRVPRRELPVWKDCQAKCKIDADNPEAEQNAICATTCRCIFGTIQGNNQNGSAVEITVYYTDMAGAEFDGYGSPIVADRFDYSGLYGRSGRQTPPYGRRSPYLTQGFFGPSSGGMIPYRSQYFGNMAGSLRSNYCGGRSTQLLHCSDSIDYDYWMRNQYTNGRLDEAAYYIEQNRHREAAEVFYELDRVAPRGHWSQETSEDFGDIFSDMGNSFVDVGKQILKDFAAVPRGIAQTAAYRADYLGYGLQNSLLGRLGRWASRSNRYSYYPTCSPYDAQFGYCAPCAGPYCY